MFRIFAVLFILTALAFYVRWRREGGTVRWFDIAFGLSMTTMVLGYLAIKFEVIHV